MKNKKLFLYFLIVVFIAPACLKKPKWEVPLTIPLLSKTYSITELLDTTDFTIAIDSSIHFIVSGRTDSIFLLDSIRFQNLSDTSNSTLHDFLIRNLDTAVTRLDAEEITGQSLPDTTIYIIVDTISILVNRTLHLTNIRNLSVASCVAQLNIINGTRLFFDSVICQINNLEPIPIYSIDSMASTTISHRCENIYLDSTASLSIFLASHGTGDDSILASTQDSITFIVTFDSLRINSGSFRSCPPRMVRKSKVRIYSLPTNYSIRINELVLRSGNLEVNLENHFPFFCSLQVAIPEFGFDTLILLPAFDSTYCALNLADRSYYNASDSLTPITLQTMFSILLDSVYVDVGPENSINVRYQVSDIQIDSLAGTIIDTIERNFSDDTIRINIPDLLSQVETVNAYAMLEVTNAIAFPLDMQINITGHNDNGDSAVIDTFFSIAPGTPTIPVNTALTLDVNPLFNIHPTFAVINARVSSVGDGWMNRNSYSTAAYTISNPLRIVLHADTIAFDPTSIQIGQKIRNTVQNYVDSSVFYAHIQNHFPASMTGAVILENPQFDTVHIGITVPSGIIDNYGLVISPADTNLVISLNQEQTRIFSDSIIQASIILYIPDTDTITVTGRDYFRIVESYVKIQSTPIPK